MTIVVSTPPASRLLTSLARRALLPTSAFAVSVALLACGQHASSASTDSSPVAATQSSALMAETVLDTTDTSDTSDTSDTTDTTDITDPAEATETTQCCIDPDTLCTLLGVDEPTDEALLSAAGAFTLTSVPTSPSAPAVFAGSAPPTWRRCLTWVKEVICGTPSANAIKALRTKIDVLNDKLADLNANILIWGQSIQKLKLKIEKLKEDLKLGNITQSQYDSKLKDAEYFLDSYQKRQNAFISSEIRIKKEKDALESEIRKLEEGKCL